MGAFFLYPQTAEISIDKIKDLFVEKGLRKYTEFKIGEYNLLLYSKILLQAPNYFGNNSDFICSVGTFIYKSLTGRDGLKLIFEDFKRGCISSNLISGSFCLLLYNEGQLYLLNDDENIYPVYLHRDSGCISSSFLALCQIADKLTIHRQSLLENLFTGCSFGFDTYFNEIKRFRWGYKTILPENIVYKSLIKEIPQRSLNTYEVQDYIKSNLSDIFQRIVPVANKLGCEIGISSGFDSRLALALCIKYLNYDVINISCNFKNPPDIDLLSAREIAARLGKSLIEVEIKRTEEMNNEYFEKTLRNSFFFYDGQFRVNHGWTREYRSLDYRKRVLGINGLGISGHGGELFRNDYNLDKKRFSYHYWIKNNILGKYGLVGLVDSEGMRSLTTYLKAKFHHIIDQNSKHIDKRSAHTYYNEVWVPSGPGIRIPIENQLSFYLSPFTDYNISKTSYSLIPQLSDSSFEKKLIKDYCSLISGVSYEKKRRALINPVFYTTLTYRLGVDLHYIQRRIFGVKNKYNTRVCMLKSFPFLERILSDPVLDSSIPVNKYIKKCVDESGFDRLIAFAFVVDYFKQKIS